MLFWLILVTAPFQSDHADAVLGVWVTPENKSKIEIYKCGDSFCGKIIDLKEKIYPPDDDRGMAGQPKVDRENPDRAKRQDPVIGLVLMHGFSYDGRIWSGGKIYDPENGKTYKCKVKLEKNGTVLNVRGYVGFSLLGRTSIWTREGS